MSQLFYYAKSGSKTFSNSKSSVGESEKLKEISLNDGPSVMVGSLPSVENNPIVDRALHPNTYNKPVQQEPAIRVGGFEFYLRFDLGQPVNQWLCVVLLGCLTLTVVLFYFTTKAEMLGENIKDDFGTRIEKSQQVNQKL